MGTLNISIPDNMREWINTQIQSGKYTSASDYLRDLVRSDQKVKNNLDELLLEGINSGDPISPDKNYWTDKKKKLKKGM